MPTVRRRAEGQPASFFRGVLAAALTGWAGPADPRPVLSD